MLMKFHVRVFYEAQDCFKIYFILGLDYEVVKIWNTVESWS